MTTGRGKRKKEMKKRTKRTINDFMINQKKWLCGSVALVLALALALAKKVVQFAEITNDILVL
jgi:hypothetical protein